MIREAVYWLGRWDAWRDRKRRRTRERGAFVARCRLRQIIALDRAAVPCGRWVHRPVYVPVWSMAGLVALAGLDMAQAMRRALRPRYRWEVRR